MQAISKPMLTLTNNGIEAIVIFHRYPAVDGALNSHHHCRDLLAVKADVDSPSPVSRASLLNGI